MLQHLLIQAIACYQIRALHQNPQIASLLNNWNMQVDENMMQVVGHVLDAPKITIGMNKGQDTTTQPRDGRWSTQFFAEPAPTPLNYWSFCIIDAKLREHEYRAVENFKRLLIDILVQKGMNVTNREPAIVDGTSPQLSNIKYILLDAGRNAIQNQRGLKPQLVICILSQKNSPVSSFAKSD